MKIRPLFIALFVLLVLFTSCDEEPATHTASTPSPTTDGIKDGDKPQTVAPNIAKTPVAPESHQCQLGGTALEDNDYWIKSAQTLVGIVANETTRDIDFGESHRIFKAINTVDCSTILEETLPVNRSPDFPWYLNTNTYEALNQVLCMQGIEFTYCYDVLGKKMLERMAPKFLNKRIAVDAQTGTPAGLDIWKHYLIAYAIDSGAYVFDLKDKNKIRAVLPNAEYYSENEESYHSLFLLADGKGMVQALIPTLNEDQDGMVSNKIFKTPQALMTTINANVRDNRYIVLNHKDAKNKMAIDMEKMTAIELPTEVAAKSAKAVLDWLKKR